VFAPSQRRRTPARQVPIAAPPARPRTPPPPTVHEPELEPVVEAPPEPVAAAASAPADAAKGGFPLVMGGLWVAVAVVVGVGLRFLKLPDYVVPMLIGVGVAAVVVLVARYFLAQDEKPAQSPAQAPEQPRKPAGSAGRLNRVARRHEKPAREVRGN
jgi:hypothetical protein